MGQEYEPPRVWLRSLLQSFLVSMDGSYGGLLWTRFWCPWMELLRDCYGGYDSETWMKKHQVIYDGIQTALICLGRRSVELPSIFPWHVLACR
jgi:hypothetical protein